MMYTVYAQLPNRPHTIVDTYLFREGALDAMERYLNRYPTAKCRVNDEEYEYTQQDFA